jgi:hypothetical protein
MDLFTTMFVESGALRLLLTPGVFDFSDPCGQVATLDR